MEAVLRMGLLQTASDREAFMEAVLSGIAALEKENAALKEEAAAFKEQAAALKEEAAALNNQRNADDK